MPVHPRACERLKSISDRRNGRDSRRLDRREALAVVAVRRMKVEGGLPGGLGRPINPGQRRQGRARGDSQHPADLLDVVLEGLT